MERQGGLPTAQVWQDVAETVTEPPRAAIQPLAPSSQVGLLPVTSQGRDDPVECTGSVSACKSQGSACWATQEGRLAPEQRTLCQNGAATWDVPMLAVPGN